MEDWDRLMNIGQSHKSINERHGRAGSNNQTQQCEPHEKNIWIILPSSQILRFKTVCLNIKIKKRKKPHSRGRNRKRIFIFLSNFASSTQVQLETDLKYTQSQTAIKREKKFQLGNTQDYWMLNYML